MEVEGPGVLYNLDLQPSSWYSFTCNLELNLLPLYTHSVQDRLFIYDNASIYSGNLLARVVTFVNRT